MSNIAIGRLACSGLTLTKPTSSSYPLQSGSHERCRRTVWKDGDLRQLSQWHIKLQEAVTV